MPGRRKGWRVAIPLLCIVVMAGGVGIVSMYRALSSPCSTATHVTLQMYNDPDTQNWMSAVVGAFNQQCHGQVTVVLHEIDTYQAMQAILNGSVHPDIWSPAGSIWLEQLNTQWQHHHHGSTIVSTDTTSTPSLVKSPVVIAMWKPMAQVLGWPDQPLWWADIAALSTNPRGWAAYGHPEWGDFKFGHTNPQYSNSGLAAILAENYAAVHKLSGLTPADVNKQATREFVENIESSVVRYGNSTVALAKEMFAGGVAYLSAAVMDEHFVAEANAGTYGPLPYSVVAIYPQEGTFIADHPFAILQGLAPAQQNAAQSLRTFLLSSDQQKKARQYYFRSSDGSGAPLSHSPGVDPAQPTVIHPIPVTIPPSVTDPLTCIDRNKVDVMLILDSSGSMLQSYKGGSKLDKAKQGLQDFANMMCDTDSLGLTVFSDRYRVLTPVSSLGPKRQNIPALISDITTSGFTFLYQTIADQVASLQRESSRHIKAVVVLTDGINDVGQLSLSALVQKLTPGGFNKGESVKVYTIAYGDPADVDAGALQQIAHPTGGMEYPGTPESISAVYTHIYQDAS
jgi:Ca-activated chloride channel family protein